MAKRQRFSQREARRKRLLAGVVAAICVAVAVTSAVLLGMVVQDLRQQGAVSVRTSILTCAKQCAAIEGSYPPSLSYLESNYGLVLNHADYAVFYDAFAENVLPNVVVTPR